MNKNNNLLHLMIAVLAIAIGYFYIDKTNPEFFQGILNKFKNNDSSWKDETIPQEKIEEIPEQEVKPEEPEEKVTPPTDDELLPPEEKSDNSRRHRR